MKANKHVKDSVFSAYFSEKNERLVELFNALEGTDYPPDTPVEVNTLQDVLWMDRVNDLSFILNGQLLVLLEHQSTINHNMALRSLLYCARLYEKLLPRDAVYRMARVKIPNPKFIILYNGQEPCPEHDTEYLSDAFLESEENPMLNLRVEVYNVNYTEHTAVQAALIERSQSLKEYSQFVYQLQQGKREGKFFEEALKDAVDYCIAHGIMCGFLEKHGSEVRNMLYTEWNMEDACRVAKEEAMEQGFAQGLEQGIAKGIEEGLEQGIAKGLEQGIEQGIEKGMAQGIEKGMEKGIEQGIEKGRNEGVRETILAFKGIIAPEVIAETLKLPLFEVLRILEPETEHTDCVSTAPGI